MVTQRKGLNNLRTLSGRSTRKFTPSKAYMRMTCLELEKSRRLQELKNAKTRLAEINARLREIETEKQTLQRQLRRMRTHTASAYRRGSTSQKRTNNSAGTCSAKEPHPPSLRLKY